MDKKQLDSLIVGIKRDGDEQAFAEFYEATRNGLFSYVLSIVKKRESAEDLMQETYIVFRKNVQSYRDGTNAFAFLVQIGKNLSLNYLKRAKYETAVDFSVWDAESDFSVEAEADTTVLDIVRGRLSEGEAQIVLLHLVSGFKHREIAEITGKPLGTVLWTYKNSLAKLKKIIEKEDANEN